LTHLWQCALLADVQQLLVIHDPVDKSQRGDAKPVPHTPPYYHILYSFVIAAHEYQKGMALLVCLAVLYLFVLMISSVRARCGAEDYHKLKESFVIYI